MIIVGSINHDEDIRHMMTARQRSRLYYIMPRQLPYDYIIKLIEARKGASDTSLVSGKNGEFTVFFQALAEICYPVTLPCPYCLLRHQRYNVLPTEKYLYADILLVTATEA